MSSARLRSASSPTAFWGVPSPESLALVGVVSEEALCSSPVPRCLFSERLSSLCREKHLSLRLCAAAMTRVVVPPQGSGRSALSRALCAKARQHLDAHVEIVDCKKLQGKPDKWRSHNQAGKMNALKPVLVFAPFICRQAGGDGEANAAGRYGAGRVEAARRHSPR